MDFPKIKRATVKGTYRIDTITGYSHGGTYPAPINSKKMKATNHFKDTIKAYLDQRAESDILFSFRYSLPEKTIDNCILWKAFHKMHCVSGYHSKVDSLILSACIDGKRIETIEVSLSQLKVIQSRGVCNRNTKYHNRIVHLVNQNIPLIEQRLSA